MLSLVPFHTYQRCMRFRIGWNDIIKFKRLSFCLALDSLLHKDELSLHMDDYEITRHSPLMLIKCTHQAQDRRHATQISPGSYEEKQSMINEASVV